MGRGSSVKGDAYDVWLKTFTEGDLTGDGKPEAAVLLSCHPASTMYSVQEVHVFTTGKRFLGRLPDLKSGRLPPLFSAQKFAIADNRLSIDVGFYSATDSHAGGPSIHRVLRWRWTGAKFLND